MQSSKYFFLALAASAVAWAQAPAASVVGRVTDSTGAVIPGVEVTVTNLATNRFFKASSNETGDFSVLYLKPGRYTLEAQSQGFHIYKHSEFRLELDQALRLDLP